MIHYIVLNGTRKNWVVVMKIFNIIVFKTSSYLPVGLRTSLHKFIFMKRIKIPLAESCDVIWRDNRLPKNLIILTLYSSVGFSTNCDLVNDLLWKKAKFRINTQQEVIVPGALAAYLQKFPTNGIKTKTMLFVDCNSRNFPLK